MTAVLTRWRPGARAEVAARRRHPAASRPIGRRNTRFVVLGFLAMLLSMLGLVFVMSASSVTDLRTHGDSWFHFKRQMLWFGFGLVAMIATMRLDYRKLRVVSRPLMAVTVVLLVAVTLPGVGLSANGARRWLGVGGLTFQPTELAKLAVLLFAADTLSRPGRRPENLRTTLRPVLVILAVVSMLVMLQPDLGSALVIVFIALAVLYYSGTHLGVMAGIGAAGLSCAVGLAFAASYRRDRIFGALDPFSDPLNTGWQSLQSAIAIANGGLSGVGLGASRGKWGFLPFAHTDFIYAIIAEEIGLFGGTLVVLAFLAIGVVGMSTALHARDRFGQLLAAGITSWIVLQALVNISAVLGLVPITGIPLPFLSFGGTSLLITMASFGVLLNIARQTS